ncbi:MAG: lipid A-modifier LpxR family protein, partial [Gammaproteobacteria bacterium]
MRRQVRVLGDGLRLIGLLSIVCASSQVLAQQTDRWRFRQFQLENDNVFPTPYGAPADRFYTNGLRVSFGKGVFMPAADEMQIPVWLRPVRRHCARCVIYPNFSVGQQIFTPEDIENPFPQPGERPWAAWLYAGFGAAIDPTDRSRHDIEVQVGVTGEPAGGEFSQKLWHKIIGSPEPAGWH